jgi:hypothetical protein
VVEDGEVTRKRAAYDAERTVRDLPIFVRGTREGKLYGSADRQAVALPGLEPRRAHALYRYVIVSQHQDVLHAVPSGMT